MDWNSARAVGGAWVCIREPPPVDHHWIDGEKYAVGSSNLRCFIAPDTRPDTSCFTSEMSRWCLLVMCCLGSIGRTDLPGGSTEQLLSSIKNKLMTLGDDVKVYSGHGPVTTIGEERLTNPFLIHRFV